MGWSRSTLELQLKGSLFTRQGRAITNFDAALPPPDSDLVRQTIKDPYCFDFLSLTGKVEERALHGALVDHVRELLLELGVGFAFVGSEHHLRVGDRDFYIDLLFYHLRLRRYVVIELKTTRFEPEHAGKLNFYLAAVDDLLRQPEDRRSIGLLLCADRDRTVVEYALSDTGKPMGVAGWTLTKDLPSGLAESLPSVELLERELQAPTDDSSM
jgi:predicted nuclease of restriction endonuclease-like (RecB) superfamily